MKTPTLAQVTKVWQGILKDPDARRAFAQLEKDGFPIKHLATEKIDDPFCEKRIISRSDMTIVETKNFSKDLRRAADLVNNVLTSDWYTRNRNPRNSLIAHLRWTVRARTGKPHDHELLVLIDAAFRAAGIKEDSTLTQRTSFARKIWSRNDVVMLGFDFCVVGTL